MSTELSNHEQNLRGIANDLREDGLTGLCVALLNAADYIKELEAERELLSCELIEARNPGIEYDPKWIATKAKRLGTKVEDTP